MKTEKIKNFIKRALKQGYVYEKKRLSNGWTSVEALEAHWFHGLYTYRRVKLSNGEIVEQPCDLDEKEFNKTLFINI